MGVHVRLKRSLRLSAAPVAALAIAVVVPAIPSGAAVARAGATHNAAVTQVTQKRVIVELAGKPALSAAGAGLSSRVAGMHAAAKSHAQAQMSALSTAQNTFLQRVASEGIKASVHGRFTQVLNAVSLTVASTDMDKLAKTPGVAGVYPDVRMRASVDPDVSLIGAPQVWQTSDPAGRADQGTGEIVAVVDTGIDYSHPDLGGGFGPGHKVVAGYNFVDGTSDPMDDNGHGTHVAGIIAGDPAGPGGRTGVAPKAELTAYKVLDSNGYGDESTIIAGLEAAVSADNPYRANVVNMSLGGTAQPGDPLDAASEAAVQSGVVVVAAAGNDGPGESTINSPGDTPDVLSVGASVSGVSVPAVSITAPVKEQISSDRMNLSADPPAAGENLSVTDVGNGLPSDYSGVDAKGKAVLVSYNSGLSDEQIAAAGQAGVAALLYRTPNYYSSTGSQPGPVLPRFAAGIPDDPDKLPFVAVFINGTNATDIQQWLGQGQVTIRIAASDATDQMPSFSSHGPTLGDYSLKPDLVAPGVEIGSTWLNGQYHDDTGTSMAAPHAAGAAALLLEAHPAWTALQVDAAMTGSAHLLSGYDGTTQGAGRLDVAAADKMTVLATPRTANFGLADLSGRALNATKTVTLSNVSGRPENLRFSVDAATGSQAKVTVVPGAIRLSPGRSATVKLTLTGPKPADGADLTGWLRASPSSGPSVTVPYLLAVRPLDLHADPDPSPAGSTVFIHSEPALATTPEVTITAPGGKRTTTSATFDHDGWWRVAIPAGRPGAYQVWASATVGSGVTLTGSTETEELAQAGPSRWESVGPDSQGAGRMAFSSRPGEFYAVPNNQIHAGLFRTDDFGASWQEIHNLPVGDGIAMGVAADPTQPDTVYLAMQGGGDDPTYQSKLLVSHDSARSWTTLPLPDTDPASISVDPSGNVLTVPTFDGNVYVSLDKGQTWASYPIPGGSAEQSKVINGDLYMPTDEGMYVIRDVVGTPSAPQLIFPAPSFRGVADVAGDGNILLADTTDQVYASRDNGATWQLLFTPPSDDPFVPTLQIVNGDIYVAGSRHIWVDHSEGTTFSAFPAPVQEGHFIVGAWSKAGTPLVVSAAGTGVFTTADNGATYHRIGLTSAVVTSMAVSKNASGQQMMLAGTNFLTFNTALPSKPGTSAALRDWGITGQEALIGQHVPSVAVDPADPSIAYRLASTAFSRFAIDKSTDGGATWTGVEGSHTSAHTYQIIDDPANPDYIYAAVVDALSPGLLVSRDGGQTWRKNDLPALITTMAADPANPDKVWLGGPDGLFLSTDNGQTMTQLSSVPVSAIAVDPNHPTHLVVGGSKLYRSRDGGKTLTVAATTGFRLSISSLVFAPDGTIYAGDDAGTDASGLIVGGRGVLASRDGGVSFDNISAGLPNLDVASLVTSPDGKWLYAGTEGGSIYRLGLR